MAESTTTDFIYATTRSGGREVDQILEEPNNPKEFASYCEQAVTTTVADDSRDLLLAPGYDGKGLQNVYDISDGFISDKQISLSMGERLSLEEIPQASHRHPYGNDAFYTDCKNWWAVAPTTPIEDVTTRWSHHGGLGQIGMNHSYPTANERAVYSMGEDVVDGRANLKSLIVKTFWPPTLSTKFLKSMVVVPESQPNKINLVYKTRTTAAGRVLYWDHGTLKVGGDFASMNALFHAIEKNRSLDDRWIEFCFTDLNDEIIGVRYHDFSFGLYSRQPSQNEVATVFRVSPDPSHDYNSVSFIVPCGAAIEQCQSGASNNQKGIRYYWTNKNDSIAFVSKEEADLQQVRAFKILTG